MGQTRGSAESNARRAVPTGLRSRGGLGGDTTVVDAAGGTSAVPSSSPGSSRGAAPPAPVSYSESFPPLLARVRAASCSSATTSPPNKAIRTVGTPQLQTASRGGLYGPGAQCRRCCHSPYPPPRQGHPLCPLAPARRHRGLVGTGRVSPRPADERQSPGQHAPTRMIAHCQSVAHLPGAVILMGAPPRCKASAAPCPWT
jgi:hypothetical protein